MAGWFFGLFDPLKKEKRLQRRVIRLLNRDSRVLSKKQAFSDKAQSGDVDVKEIPKIRHALDLQKKYIRKIHAMDVVKIKIDESLKKHLLSLYSGVGEKGKEEISIEKQAADEFLSDVSIELRVLQKWETILGVQRTWLTGIERNRKLAVKGFAQALHQEGMLLHLLLRDERTESELLEKLQQLDKEVEELGDNLGKPEKGTKAVQGAFPTSNYHKLLAALMKVAAETHVEIYFSKRRDIVQHIEYVKEEGIVTFEGAYETIAIAGQDVRIRKQGQGFNLTLNMGLIRDESVFYEKLVNTVKGFALVISDRGGAKISNKGAA